MGWFDKVLGRGTEQRQNTLLAVQKDYTIFKELLDQHNFALKRLSRLEERMQHGRISSVIIWDEFLKIREGVYDTIERMIELGGQAYAPLRHRLAAISQEIEDQLPVGRPIAQDEYTLPLSRLNRERAFSVGTKNANLGELQSILGLPVPEGFAISAWAYKHFLDANQLQTRVSRLLQDVRIRNYQDLEILSEDIREAVTRKSVPDDLAEAIFLAFDELSARTGKSGFALRSSAVGEDTAFSFAGQYLSFLNVPREDLLDRYKQILASKFTPSAIYYLLSHSLSDLDLGMGVVCMEMVDAAASGVLYTVDPLNPDGDYLVVNSIFGLGSYLVEGKITPDVFHVSRSNGEVVSAQIHSKPVQLRLGDKKNTEAAAVLEPDQPSLDPETLALLCRYALQVEEHFGCPQDVEWALDRSGKLFLLQARPLALAEKKSEFNVPATFDSLILLKGGTPICSGLGSGPVFHLTSIADLDRVPSGAILVTTNPSPYLVAAMDKISGLVTVVGGNASHLATLARELGLPTVVGMTGADELLANRQVTLDAGKGVIYDGNHPEWVSDQPESPAAAGNTIDESVRKMIYPIVHLDVIHPSDPEFTAENCHTLHNVLRFIHQKAMEEIFTKLKRTTNKDKIGLRLKTKIPLIVNIIYLDQNYLESKSKRWVTETEIQSRPMQALWGGILEEGWPQTPVPADLKGFLAVVGANIQEGHHPEFSENSYAFLSQEYMLLNLRMGYHFSSIEAMAAPEPEKNYIRMQFKLGGAPLERRIRRIWLISELLALMGFENSPQGDFLDSLIAYQSEEGVLERLRQLGRITILTKQLDMALSSDARVRWYFEEFSRKLDLRT